jgi:pyroglutamyl-peptidase
MRTTVAFAAAGLAAAVSVASAFAEDPPPARAPSADRPADPGAKGRGENAPVVLLTGFDPFGGAPTNASWEAVRTFEGKTIAGHRVAVARLPVVYDEMERPLLDAIAKHDPRVVVCFGVGTPVVHVERTARNGYHPARHADNRGRPPPREKIVADGAETIATGLPVERILAALGKARIGAAASDDAGGYLCNECFYRLMRAEAPRVVRRGFVHVPPVGTEDPAGGAFTLERLCAAVEIVVAETLAASPVPATPAPAPAKAPAPTSAPAK